MFTFQGQGAERLALLAWEYVGQERGGASLCARLRASKRYTDGRALDLLQAVFEQVRLSVDFG